MMHYRYLNWVTAIFVACLITANIIAVKLIDIGGLILPAAVIIFPVSYIVGDVLTEVYGYARARQVIWIGFTCNLIAVIAIAIPNPLPPPPRPPSDQGAAARRAGHPPAPGIAQHNRRAVAVQECVRDRCHAADVRRRRPPEARRRRRDRKSVV